MAVQESRILKKDAKPLQDMIEVRAHEERLLGFSGWRTEHTFIQNTVPVWTQLGLLPPP